MVLVAVGFFSGRRPSAAASSGQDQARIRPRWRRDPQGRPGALVANLLRRVASGVPILQAVKVTGQTSGNAVVEQAMDDVYASVRGAARSPARSRRNRSSRRLVATWSPWEGPAVEHIALQDRGFYEDEVDAKIKALTSLIEPLMICFVGASWGSSSSRCTCRFLPLRKIASGAYFFLQRFFLADEAWCSSPALALLGRGRRRQDVAAGSLPQGVRGQEVLVCRRAVVSASARSSPGAAAPCHVGKPVPARHLATCGGRVEGTPVTASLGS